MLLSLKKKPVIRYEKSSAMAKKLGVEIQVCLRWISIIEERREVDETVNVLASDTNRIAAVQFPASTGSTTATYS